MDIVIVGAGVAGCTAALALEPQARVLLIDKRARPQTRIGECLAPSARRVLGALGLLDEFEQAPHLDALGIQSHWGGEQARISDHVRNPDGCPKFLDRAAFESWLRLKAKQGGAQTLWPQRVQAIKRQGDLWHILTAAGVQIRAPYLIDASGPTAVVARSLGVERRSLDQLLACWLTLTNGRPSQHSLIAAAAGGWWYSSPLPGQKRLLAYHTDADLLPTAVRRHASGFLALARDCPAVSAVLAATSEVTTSVSVRSAATRRLVQFSGPGWCALGDAAFSMDPLSSQGMYHAMASAMQLATLLQDRTQAAFSIYAKQQESIWNQYLRHRTVYYESERRWLQRCFWKRRCSAC